MSVEFALEAVADVWDEAQPLIRAHGREVRFFAGLEPDLDRDMMVKLDELGLLRLFTARVAGRLVGYAVVFVNRHMHYRGQVWAVQDALYVLPEHRGRMVLRFLAWQDDRLTKLGCSVIVRHSTVHRDYTRVLEHQGYVPLDHGYARRLDA